MYRAITITKGSAGWGGPLSMKPTDKRNKVVSVTGGGIHPVAAKIAEMSGATPVDGFSTGVPDDEIMVVVIDCGGTARCGVYPKKKLYTVNLTAVGQSGPLAKFITEDLYVSDVTESCIAYADDSAVAQAAKPALDPKNAPAPKTKAQARAELAEMNAGKKKNIITRMGIGVGSVVNKFYQAGRETIDMVMKNILPFMALPGMIVISVICALPFISPVLGPGAVIAQIVGSLLGVQIGLGNIPPQYALPALFAIDAQVGADFVPVGLSLGEAEPETIELGVPAVLYSRLITGPLAVVIAYVFSIGLYA